MKQEAKIGGVQLQVLEEKSSPYTGSTESADQYLQKTYVRPQLTPEKYTWKRRIFDACNWTNPTEDQSSFLNRTPSREEIELKLRRATNTSPGADGIEYRHIKALDPQCHLLEVIYERVWQIGIPDAWRRSRTVPIFKKGDPSDFSNFCPFSLLSRLTSCRSDLQHEDWKYLHRARLGHLPLRGYTWSSFDNKSCRYW
jgi:hypothetical protein